LYILIDLKHSKSNPLEYGEFVVLKTVHASYASENKCDESPGYDRFIFNEI